MTRSRLLVAVTVVLAVTTLVFGVLGALYNLILLILALPFALAAGFLWFHVSGRLAPYLQPERVTRTTNRRRRRRPPDESVSTMQARAILDVDTDADIDDIREAYRARVMEVHPDTDTGSEEEFKRLQAAYDRLSRRIDNREGF